MTWIKTIPLSEGEEALNRAVEGQRGLYPGEYAQLIPDALYHAFATFGVLMSSELPLTRRQHEMITTMVSVVNRCHY
ncbi:MAG: hypothetical protein DMF60_10130 [Acidobacteria bacterium]|nr:MAG: hypothetical protein DMF60_10130 [Acidobacteriota bacterium]